MRRCRAPARCRRGRPPRWWPPPPPRSTPRRLRVGADQPGLGRNLRCQRRPPARLTPSATSSAAGVRLQYAWPPLPAGAENAGENAADSEGPRQCRLPDVELRVHPAERQPLRQQRPEPPAFHPPAQPPRSRTRCSVSTSSTSSSGSNSGCCSAAAGRFRLMQGSRAEVFAGAGYMFERETLDLPAALPDARRSEDHRSTNYLTVRYNSEDERLRLVHTLYAQPRFDQAAGLPPCCPRPRSRSGSSVAFAPGDQPERHPRQRATHGRQGDGCRAVELAQVLVLARQSLPPRRKVSFGSSAKKTDRAEQEDRQRRQADHGVRRVSYVFVRSQERKVPEVHAQNHCQAPHQVAEQWRTGSKRGKHGARRRIARHRGSTMKAAARPRRAPPGLPTRRLENPRGPPRAPRR